MGTPAGSPGYEEPDPDNVHYVATLRAVTALCDAFEIDHKRRSGRADSESLRRFVQGDEDTRIDVTDRRRPRGIADAASKQLAIAVLEDAQVERFVRENSDVRKREERMLLTDAVGLLLGELVWGDDYQNRKQRKRAC